jgi:hypothetical protein
MEEKKVKKRLAFAFSKIIAQHFWQDMMKTTFLVEKKYIFEGLVKFATKKFEIFDQLCSSCLIMHWMQLL